MPSLLHKFVMGCAHFWPHPLYSSRRERVAACLGAALGLIITESLCRYVFGEQIPWLIAPMGASAVLIFAIPGSPLAQPWSVVGGNLVASLVGVSCALVIPDSEIAAGMAVALSIALMFPLRCVHPPSGAVAITAVLGGPAITQLGYGFVLYPVLVNSLLLILVALVFNNACKRRYPHALQPPHSVKINAGSSGRNPVMPLSLDPEDLRAALATRDEIVDVDEGDLLEIFAEALQNASRRQQRSRGDSPHISQK